MKATVDHVPATPEDEEDNAQTPMTDREHRRAFGWAWDDPDVEAGEWS